MDESNIRKYANLMRELGLTGLEISEDNRVVRLERSAPAASASSAAPEGPLSAGEAPAADYLSIRSPMVGVFYAAPAQDADPFVKVGSAVKKGTVLCVIEAMKLMNEITAEQDGIISEICLRDGETADYGCELFRIRR